MKQSNKDILNNLDILFNVGEEEYLTRQEVLNEYIELMSEHYFEIEAAEKLENYEYCKTLHNQIPLIQEVYACYMDKFSGDTVNQHLNNVNILSYITQQIKNKILNKTK